MMKLFKYLVAFGFMVFLTNCVSLTVNVYFPEKQINDAAQDIEERVRSGKGTEGLSALPYQNSPGRRFRLVLNFGVNAAHAQNNVDISIETPVIKQIIKQRTERYKQLKPYYNSGVIGEGMDGYLAIRSQEGLDLKGLTQVKNLVEAENADRKTLYQEILKENGLEVSKQNLERVQKEFFEAIRIKMEVGHYYQTGKESWAQMTAEMKKKLKEQQ